MGVGVHTPMTPQPFAFPGPHHAHQMQQPPAAPAPHGGGVPYPSVPVASTAAAAVGRWGDNPKNILAARADTGGVWPKGKIPAMTISRVGPDHMPRFDASLAVPLPHGRLETVVGSGGNKQAAQRACAEAACDVLHAHGCLADALALKKKRVKSPTQSNDSQATKKGTVPAPAAPVDNTPKALPPAQLCISQQQMSVCTAALQKLRQEEEAQGQGEAIVEQKDDANAANWEDAYQWDGGDGDGDNAQAALKDTKDKAAAAAAAAAAVSLSLSLSLSAEQPQQTVGQPPSTATEGKEAEAEPEPRAPNTAAASPGVTAGSASLQAVSKGLSGSLLDTRLQQRYATWLQAPQMQQRRQARAQLPANSSKAEVLAAVDTHQVVIIQGETGCGKTTQIPQFLLEAAEEAGSGSAVSVVCTQPRKIAAVTVAERVAWERGESIGDSIGYKVQLEGKRPRAEGSILYCTTGVLLLRLQHTNALDRISHVVIDEAHERDINTDFLMAVLRDLLPSTPQLKVIIMSATIETGLFAKYFDAAVELFIPGRTFNVVDQYPMQLCHTLAACGAPPQLLQRLEELEGGVQDWTRDETEVDAELVASVTHYLSESMHQDFGAGAILVFLPGWSEISAVQKVLQQNFPPQQCRVGKTVLPLHSNIPSADQRLIFQPAAQGTRKIILATNIAETSVTINDVVYVVDTGRCKEKCHNVHRDVTVMRTCWISQASARQRSGRAGRVRDGHCARLYSKQAVHEVTMRPHQIPEMQRVPLEELVLQLAAIRDRGKGSSSSSSAIDKSAQGRGASQQFLSRSIQPPEAGSVWRAVASLTRLGAIDEQETLTPLGRALAKIPAHPRIGKMLVIGSILGCCGPLYVLAASLVLRDPFVQPFQSKAEADTQRTKFAQGPSENSDHLALLSAFEGWKQAGDDLAFCRDKFLSAATMRQISGLSDQLRRTLADVGLNVQGAAWERNPLMLRSCLTVSPESSPRARSTRTNQMDWEWGGFSVLGSRQAPRVRPPWPLQAVGAAPTLRVSLGRRSSLCGMCFGTL